MSMLSRLTICTAISIAAPSRHKARNSDNQYSRQTCHHEISASAPTESAFHRGGAQPYEAPRMRFT